MLTPGWWDRDCRLCMDRRIPTADFSKRAMKGAVECTTVAGEEIHAWHTTEERTLFYRHEMDLRRAR